MPDVAAEGEAGELAFALDVDEAGSFEFFEVMREGGGGDGETIAHIATAGTAIGAQAFDDFHAARIGEGFEDGHALAGREGDMAVACLGWSGFEVSGSCHALSFSWGRYKQIPRRE